VHPDGSVVLLPKIPASALRGIVKPRRHRPVTIEEIAAAAAAGARRRSAARQASMIGLDTNILVRYLAQDDPVQSAKAGELIEQQLTEDNPGFLSVLW